MIGGPDETRVKRNVTVGACSEADEPAVLALLASAFGRWPTGLDAEPGAFFRWKHKTSPFGPSIGLVAQVDGEVAGFLALMPWRLCFADAIYETIRGVDIAVAPGFQRLGIANVLIAASRSSYSDDIALSWSNPNERSRPGVLKAGRKRVDGLPRFVGSGGAVLGTAKRLLSGPPPPADEADDESLVVALADEALLERVLSGPSPIGRISTAYDVDFLRWRYGQQGHYRAVVSEHPRAGAGIAIFRTQMRGRFSVTFVCELLTERNDERVERELVRRVRQKARTDFLACAFTSSRAARRCGLVRSRRTAMIAANPLHDGLEPNPTQASAWALSLGDLEVI
jgi:GNAT superfamily N-acetyltransferase